MAATSRARCRPAYEGSRRGNATRDASRRWQLANASFTYVSPQRAIRRAKDRLLEISSGQKRIFSKRKTSEDLPYASIASFWKGSRKRMTFCPSKTCRRRLTGSRVNLSSRLPPGLPRYPMIRICAPRRRRYRSVGKPARRRKSSATLPFFTDTSKSIRTKNRLPSFCIRASLNIGSFIP